METYQRNIHVEGSIASNSLIEGLNTKIFKDIGIGNNIVIDVKGYKNGKKDQNIIDSYDLIKDIPIKIIKNGDMTSNTKLTFKISNLTEVNLNYIDKNNEIRSDFPSSLLKNGNETIILRIYNSVIYLQKNVNVFQVENC